MRGKTTTDVWELIEEAVVAHGGDLGGWTRRGAELDDSGPADDGMVHAHVFTQLHEHEDEVLDACLFGMGDDRSSALGQAAMIWLTCVAGPIKSFIDNKPVCVSCQAGLFFQATLPHN